jgi:hypothetical protein
MTPKDGTNDLIFSQSSSGAAYIVDDATLRQVSNPQVADEEAYVAPPSSKFDLTMSESVDHSSTMDSGEEVVATATQPSTTKQMLGRTISRIRARTAGYKKAPQSKDEQDSNEAMRVALGNKYETVSGSPSERRSRPIGLRQQIVDDDLI